MIDKFLEWINGTYENKIQSLSQPTKYKYVRLTHCVLPNNFIYVEQKNFFEDKVYRQYALRPIQIGEQIFVKNYTIQKERYLGFKNLNDFLTESFEYKEGCDSVLNFLGDKFVGNIQDCNCIVELPGEKTYVKNSVILSEDTYKIYDKGYSVKTDKRVWGSAHGHFEFQKIDKGYLWEGG